MVTRVAADRLENADLEIRIDAGSMAHVYVDGEPRPLCFKPQLVTAEANTLPAFEAVPADLCGRCRGLLLEADTTDASDSREVAAFRLPSRH